MDPGEYVHVRVAHRFSSIVVSTTERKSLEKSYSVDFPSVCTNGIKWILVAVYN
jgi:hypothetical protein